MKDQKLKDLVSELILKIQQGTESPLHYELCPYFNDCPIDIVKRCVSLEYKECVYYQNYQNYRNLKHANN